MKTSLWFSWMIFIIAIVALCVAIVRCEPIRADWASVLVGVLGSIVTALIGWQIYKSIELNNILKRVSKVEKSAKDVEYMLYATSEQICGSQYKDKPPHHELWHYMLALEYLNKATNSQYENIIKEIRRLACSTPFTILDKSRLISALYNTHRDDAHRLMDIFSEWPDEGSPDRPDFVPKWKRPKSH
ncbi:MAG: hypothetical protein HDR82_09490 [Bacteroides sp.]|nr:hypothetical protein [Bacteroides sp.]